MDKKEAKQDTPKSPQKNNKVGIFYKAPDDKKWYLYKTFWNQKGLEHFLSKDEKFEKLEKEKVAVIELQT